MIFARPIVVAVALFSSSIAFAASPAIGTVSTRGEIRVSGYSVKGTATLFENTAVETSEFSAVMRLDKGTEIKLASGSSGTLFHDRLVLSRGESELTAKSPFQLQASGLEVSASLPDSSGIVAIGPQNTVEVATLQGELNVTNSQGVLLAHVTPGAAISFDAGQAAPSAPGSAFADVGIESFDQGHYYLTSSQTGLKYQIVGNNLTRYVNVKIVINGKLLQGTPDHPLLVQVIASAVNGGDQGMSGTKKTLLIAIPAAAAAVGIGYAIASASR